MYRLEDLPQIKNHYFLSTRGIGASRALRGKVGIMTCFMKRSPSDFSEKSLSQYYAALNEACRWLEAEAKKRNVPLQIEGYHFEIDVPANANPRSGYSLVKDFFGERTVDAVQAHYEKDMKLDEAPFLLVFDKVDRSFAWNKAKTDPFQVDELSVIFKDEEGYQWNTIAHELLHQFGAVDLYFPEQVRICAGRYLGYNIMSAVTREIDELTAYLIGWTDTISADTYSFLKETMWLTESSYRKAIIDAWRG